MNVDFPDSPVPVNVKRKLGTDLRFNKCEGFTHQAITTSTLDEHLFCRDAADAQFPD